MNKLLVGCEVRWFLLQFISNIFCLRTISPTISSLGVAVKYPEGDVLYGWPEQTTGQPP
jgi:hypothetical protein